MDLGQLVVDKTKHSVPFGVPKIVPDGRQPALVLERFSNAKIGYRCRNRNRKRCQSGLFSVEHHFVTWWAVGTFSRTVIRPGKMADGVIVRSYGEELHCIHEGFQRPLIVVS